MRRVILESPYGGDTDRCMQYANACLRDSLLRGEAPIASHLVYAQPGVIEPNHAERLHGLGAASAWHQVAEAVVVYLDLGLARNMLRGIATARAANVKVEYRVLPVDIITQLYRGWRKVLGSGTRKSTQAPAV